MKTVKANLEFDIEKAKQILADYAESHDMAEPYPQWLYDKLHDLTYVVVLSIDDGEDETL